MEKKYDTVLCNTRVPLDVQNTTELHRKWASPAPPPLAIGSYVLNAPCQCELILTFCLFLRSERALSMWTYFNILFVFGTNFRVYVWRMRVV